MSLVISSTTDDQAAVNAAAGIAPPPAEQEETTEAIRPPREEPEEEEPEEEEEGEEQQEGEGEPESPTPRGKRLGGWQRQIQKLREANDYAYRKLAQVEDELGQLKPRQEPPKGPPPRPKLEDYPDNYDAYIEAVTDWKTDRKLEAKEADNLNKARQWQQQEAERTRLEGWNARAREFAAKTPDFNEVLNSVGDINFHPAVQQALELAENGPRLAYELARNRSQLEKLAALTNPLDALRELGRFEAKLTTGPPPRIEARKPFTPAPEPIRPVGKGSNGNVHIPLDQRNYQDFKHERERMIKARRG